MTKKRRLIPLILLGCLVALLLAAAAVLGTVYAGGGGITVGQYLNLPDHEAHFLIDGTTLIRLSGNEAQFASFHTGDTIAVTHGEVAETYPAQATAYHSFCVRRGNDGEIPLEILQTLSQLGYFDDGAALPGRVEFQAQYIPSSTDFGMVTYPTVRVIRSVEELHAHYETVYPQGYTGMSYDHSTPLLEAFNTYTDAYFEDRVLLLVMLQNGSGSISHTVTAVTEVQGGLAVDIDEHVPSVMTMDMKWWHILIEPEAGTNVPDASCVTVTLTRRHQTWPTTVCSYPTK